MVINNAQAITKFSKGDLALKNYGFSYCLSQSDDMTMQFETSHAMGGFFETGTHGQPAYDNVKKYIDNYLMNKVGEYKDTGKTAILMGCLDMYNTTGYDQLIKKQKRFSHEK